MSVINEVSDKPDLEELVNAYLTIRKERDILTQQYEARDAELKADLSALEQVMLGACNEIKADSIRTQNGTIIRQMKENFICGDWDNFKKFIIENNVPELLQQRIHQSNFKEFLHLHPDDGLPPGINTMREFTVVVRKPTKKSD